MALILFDFDGVLADTLPDLIAFGQAVCDELGVPHVVSADDLSRLESMSFAAFGRACQVPEELVAEFVQRCLKRFAEKPAPPPIFPGLDRVVKHLAVHNLLAIITTNSAPNVHAFLREHALEACIQAVYGIDTPGSKAEKIAAARQRFSAGRQPGRTFMVGDALSDLRAAKEGAATSIAVTWGHQSLEHLLRGDPDHVAHSPHELIEIIEK